MTLLEWCGVSMAKELRAFSTGRDDEGRRLDRVLRIILPGISLSSIYKAMRKGLIKLNGSRARPDNRLGPSEQIGIATELLRGIKEAKAQEPRVDAESYPLIDIIFRNDDLICLSKPRGLLSHGHEGADHFVRSLIKPSSQGGLSFRPGPLHRLDRNTSGILCLSLSSRGAREGTLAFRENRVHKLYAALFSGKLDGEEEWEDRLLRDHDEGRTQADPEGAYARARFFPVLSKKEYSLGAILLFTGKTHQIRVQSSLRGHPLAGDKKYGAPSFPGGYLLHAGALSFVGCPDFLPRRLICPFPDPWKEPVESIFGNGALSQAQRSLSDLFDALDQPMGTY